MIKRFVLPPNSSAQRMMQRVGYTYHCGKDGRPCYHRQLNDPPFPRFHAYVIEQNGRMEVDLHFDAHDLIDQKSNHDQPWAYKGGRVEQEMQRISDVIEGRPIVQVAGIDRIQKNERPKRERKNLFDLLFG